MNYALSFLLVLLSITAVAQQAPATEPQNCVLVENARERLACYDRTFSRDGSTPLPKITSEVIAPPAAVTSPAPRAPGQTEVQREPRSATQADRTAPAARKGAPGSEGNRSKPLFDWGEKVDFSAKIKSVRAKGEQRMVFLLDNDQMWMQSTPRYVPIKEGDTVTIKSGTIGGFIMRNQNETSTRVNRIK